MRDTVAITWFDDGALIVVDAAQSPETLVEAIIEIATDFPADMAVIHNLYAVVPRPWASAKRDTIEILMHQGYVGIAVAAHSLWRVKNLLTAHHTDFRTVADRNELAEWMHQQSRQPD
ncbi:MAG: hypothetical protein L0154_15525 [Chloroflexi bacterium]|nr:hypothetical protein [Chloroflexota bacterium]